MFSSYELRLLRDSRQIKQQQIAQMMGISKQRYSQLENHPQLSPVRQQEILSALGYTVKTARKYLNNIPGATD